MAIRAILHTGKFMIECLTPHSTKLCCAQTGAKAPTDLLLDFQHPQVSLRLVIIKRDSKVIHEPQDFIALGT